MLACRLQLHSEHDGGCIVGKMGGAASLGEPYPFIPTFPKMKPYFRDGPCLLKPNLIGSVENSSTILLIVALSSQ
jgi:hypothetical protein